MAEEEDEGFVAGECSSVQVDVLEAVPRQTEILADNCSGAQR